MSDMQNTINFYIKGKTMKVLCVAQVEKEEPILHEISKQTYQPYKTVLYTDPHPAHGIIERRKRIAENHSKLKAIVEMERPEMVWQVEGDCSLPPDTLEKLMADYAVLNARDNFGYISGIQVGRHGLYCLGAWTDFTIDSFRSLDYTKEGIQEVSATGFYCLLAPTQVWLSGVASWNGEPYGPDVVWGLSLNKRIYVDMDIPIGHKIKGGIIEPYHISTCNAQFYRENGRWEYKQL